MIKFISDNKLIYNTLSNYLLQKNLLLSKNNYQVLIEIKDRVNVIHLNINGHITTIPLPIDINFVSSTILKKIIDINFPIADHKYFPYQRVICSKNKKSLLSDIQNLIISNLIINQKGIDKDQLYNLIWKRDKLVHINKLDTHLTNLKKKLKQELDLKINFQSQNKTLHLLID